MGEERTLSFADAPADNGESDADRVKILLARVKQLEQNIEFFISRVKNVQFNVDAEDAALWMLDWEHELLLGELSEEEDETSEQAPLERSTIS